MAVQSFLGKLDGKKSLVNNGKWRGSRRQGNGSQFGELWRKKQTVSYNHPLFFPQLSRLSFKMIETRLRLFFFFFFSRADETQWKAICGQDG